MRISDWSSDVCSADLLFLKDEGLVKSRHGEIVLNRFDRVVQFAIGHVGLGEAHLLRVGVFDGIGIPLIGRRSDFLCCTPVVRLARAFAGFVAAAKQLGSESWRERGGHTGMRGEDAVY